MEQLENSETRDENCINSIVECQTEAILAYLLYTNSYLFI